MTPTAAGPQVKICGITSLADALCAVEAGAEYLGFVFARSSRQVTIQKASSIIRQIPDTVHAVGVFVDEPMDKIADICRQCGLAVAQLHGSEHPEDIGRLSGVEVWKAFRVREAGLLQDVSRYRTCVQAVVLDAYVPDLQGGTGISFDWSLSEGIDSLGVPIVLAGGLNPENVSQAIRKVHPAVVDVSSGVELSPGHKDPARVAAFVHAVRTVLG